MYIYIYMLIRLIPYQYLKKKTKQYSYLNQSRAEVDL